MRQTYQQRTLKNIGSKIRAERKHLGLSLEALAKKVGISKMTLQRIETGATSPSIIHLTEIAFHLKRPVDSIIREGEAKVVHLRKDQRDTLFNRQKKFRLIAPKGLISDRITLTYSELEKDMIIEKHTNNGFEWAFLIEGSALVEISGAEYLFKAGDAIFYDAHFPHSIRVEQKIKYVGLFLQDE
jgi:transcriptional regulator with XRE-family HTH domain